MECAGYSKQEVLDSLRILKKICAETDCAECPFYRDYEEKCLFKLGLVPCYFKINGDESVWRATIN